MGDLGALIAGLPGATAQGLIWGIMAIGVYITYKVLDVADLTVDGSICTGGATCIMMLMAGYSMPVALVAAFIAGCLTGLCTGFIHTFMGIPAILAGILTQLALYSINLKIMGKANQPINANNFDLLVSLRNVRNVPIGENTILITFIITAILIGILYWFFGTELGCSIRASGANEAMCRAQGIPVDFNKVFGLTVSNGIVAFSGALLAQYQGFADVNMGRGAIVIGLAAVVIGEAVFGKFSTNFAYKLSCVVVGSIIYYYVLQIVIWQGLDPQLLKLLSAVIVAIFLAVPYWRNRYFKRSHKRPAKTGENPEEKGAEENATA